MDFLVYAFVDFDDTMFPSSQLLSFFDIKTCTFSLSPEMQIRLNILDRLLFEFFTTFTFHQKFHTRFRIVTHADEKWLGNALKLLPKVQRLREWHFLEFIPCFEKQKYDIIYHLQSKEETAKVYFSAGDQIHDTNMIQNAFRMLQWNINLFNIKTMKFIENPNIENIIFQWKNIFDSFENYVFTNSSDHVHFVVDENNLKKVEDLLK